MIQLKYCTIEKQPWGSTIRYPDGTESSSWPLDTDFYRWVVAACGHDDPVNYCFEHEFCHVFLPEFLFDDHSAIIWNNAHKEHIDSRAGAWEEKLIFYFQQYLNNQIDMSFDHQLVEAKARARELLKYSS